jgi:alpha-amylase
MRKSFTALLLGVVLLLSTFTFQSNATDMPGFAPISRGDLANDSVYFVMTDRFNNGNKENDEAYVGGGLLGSGYDPTSPLYWHGGDFQGLKEKLPYIKKLGFTSIWITPPVVQNWVQAGSGGYHGYWGVDFTTVDPHLGTEAEFKELVAKAHELGMKVIVDIVINHTGDVIKSAIGMYTYADSFEMPYRDSKGKVFNFTNFIGKSTFPKLDAKKSFPRPPFVSSYYKNFKKPSWLNDVTNYHNRGDSTFSGESNLYGDFVGLDDLFTEKPEVIKGMIDLWSSWITKFDIDGYRIDTAKHVNPEFWVAFLPKVLAAAKKAGKQEFPIFGEIYDPDPYYLASFITDQKFPSVLDFGFQSKALGYVRAQGQTYKLVDLFNTDDVYTTATTSAYGQPTFLGNHDMGRVGRSLYSATYGEDELTLERAKLANEVLFFSRGAPVLYYGDEKGLVGTNGDSESRQDLFPTKVEEWKNQYRIGMPPIGNKSAFDTTHPLELQIENIAKLIEQNPALRSGTQQIRATSDGAFAMSRYADGQEYVVIYNADEKAVAIDIPVTTNSPWSQIYGPRVALSVAGKKISLKIPAVSTLVLKADSKFVSSAPLSVSLQKIGIDYATPYWLGLRATVPGDEFVQVNFQMRIKGAKSWSNLGTADRRTFQSDDIDGGLYRAFIQPRKFKSGTSIEVIAIARNESGKLAYSKVQSFTIKY